MSAVCRAINARRRMLLVGALVAAATVVVGGPALHEATASPSACAAFPPTFSALATRAQRTSTGSETVLSVTRAGPTCGAAIRVGVDRGNAVFVRIPTTPNGVTSRAFRLKSANLCRVKLSARLDLRDTVTGAARRTTCETSLLSVALTRFASSTGRAARDQCVNEGILVRRSAAAARAHRDVIPIDITIQTMSAGAQFQATDMITIKVNDGKGDAPAGIGFPDDSALLKQCAG